MAEPSAAPRGVVPPGDNGAADSFAATHAMQAAAARLAATSPAVRNRPRKNTSSVPK